MNTCFERSSGTSSAGRYWGVVAQNEYRPLSCTRRWLPLMEEITPGVVLLPIVELGVPRFGWLSALNASKRNSKLPASFGIVNTRPTARLTVTLPGVLRIFRPELPNVPASGTEKHEASNHWFFVGFDNTPLQVRLGRVAWPRSWVPETFGVNGWPL